MEMLHVERMAAMEKGVKIPLGAPKPWSPRVYLLRGLMWTFGGAALTVFLFAIAPSTHHQQSAELSLLQAKNVSERLNIPLDEARKIIDADRLNREEGLPSAIGFLGLVPMGIGLAYLIFYFTDKSRPQPQLAESEQELTYHP
jgi:hypothetical protein